jgi:hypothetical protein
MKKDGMNYTINFYKVMLKIGNKDLTKPFYASDFGLNGGEINSLNCAGCITPTGKRKEVFYPVDIDSKLYRKDEVLEWRFKPSFLDYLPHHVAKMREDVETVLALINDLHRELGI